MKNNIRLFQLLKNRSDGKTAGEAMSALTGTIKDEVTGEIGKSINSLRTEFTEKLHWLELKIRELEVKMSELELRMIDRINSAKIQTILWVVGMSIVQLLARYFFK